MTIGPVDDADADPRSRMRNLLFVAVACVVALIICLGTFKSASAATGRAGITSRLNTPSAQPHSATQGVGYWLAASDGGIFSEGGAPFKGSTGSLILNKPIVGMSATPDGDGYWLAASDGGVFNYGDAAFEGSAGALRLNRPIVGMASTPDGNGYWLVASDGGIFNYGDAAFEGSAGAVRLNQAIVGMASTPDGKGYWLVASDGGVFNYGDAVFEGSAGGIHLNKPIVGMAATPDGKGYWLVGSDGGIFNYGDAGFHGSTGGISLNKPIVGMTSSLDGNGYWLAASDGGVFNYGDSAFDGSTGGLPLNKPIVGMAVRAVSGPASKLVFSTEPSGASGGTAFSTQPVVTVEDAEGDTVTGDTSRVTLSITANTPTVGGPGNLSGCATSAAINGVASFAGCSINTAGAGYELHAVDASLDTANSTAFTVTVGTANHLAFTTSPVGSTGGTAFTTQPVVTVEDAGGNMVSGNTSTVALSIAVGTPTAGGPGALSGCAPIAASAGVATFTGCFINTEGVGYELHAVDGSLTSVDSSAFNVTVGTASQLAFTVSPEGATGGTAFTIQPVVAVEDAGGNTVTTDASTPTLSITSGTPTGGGSGALSGCTPSTRQGVTTYTGCSINIARTGYELHAVDGTFAAADSSTFDVTIGQASQLVFTVQPGNATAGSAFGTQPVVTIEDAGGNTVPTDTISVTMAIASGAGVISGCSETTTAGVAIFSGCSINRAGPFRLRAGEGVDSELSDQFTVT
jgi:hypothetical protein